MAEEKKEHVANSSGKYIEMARKNPWMPAAIVLAVILVIVLFMGGGSFGKSVSKTTAANNLVSLIKSQSGQDAQIISATEKNGLYYVNISISGQSIPVYITKDGQYAFVQPIPLATTASSSSSSTTETQNVPKSNKPIVDVFVMSYCPYGTQIEKGLLSVVSLLGSKIDFKIRWVDYTLHGAVESDENTVQYCIERDQNSKYLEYLQCFLNNSGVYSGTPNTGQSLLCQKQVGIDNSKLQSCLAGTNVQYNITTANYQAGQSYGIDAADNQKYGVQGSPTVVVNGVQVSTGRSPAALLKTICSAFSSAPSECSTVLASDTPTPGFSFSSSSGADTSAASCGV